MLFITLTYHNNLLKKMNNDANYDSENDSDFESDCSTLNDNYFPDKDQINCELK